MDRHEHIISATIKTKCHRTIEFRFEVIVLVSLSFIFVFVLVFVNRKITGLYMHAIVVHHVPPVGQNLMALR